MVSRRGAIEDRMVEAAIQVLGVPRHAPAEITFEAVLLLLQNTTNDRPMYDKAIVLRETSDNIIGAYQQINQGMEE